MGIHYLSHLHILQACLILLKAEYYSFLGQCDFYCTGWFVWKLRKQGYSHKINAKAELKGYCGKEKFTYIWKYFRNVNCI